MVYAYPHMYAFHFLERCFSAQWIFSAYFYSLALWNLTPQCAIVSPSFLASLDQNMILSERLESKLGRGGLFYPFCCSFNVSNVCLSAQYCANVDSVKKLTSNVLLASESLHRKNIKFAWGKQDYLKVLGQKCTFKNN